MYTQQYSTRDQLPRWIAKLLDSPLLSSQLSNIKSGDDFSSIYTMSAAIQGMIDQDSLNVINTLGTQHGVTKDKTFTGNQTDSALTSRWSCYSFLDFSSFGDTFSLSIINTSLY